MPNAFPQKSLPADQFKTVQEVIVDKIEELEKESEVKPTFECTDHNDYIVSVQTKSPYSG